MLMIHVCLCSGVRPFGVALLICGIDDGGAQLYQVDPSGSYWAWKAAAIGKGMINAQSFLEKRFVFFFFFFFLSKKQKFVLKNLYLYIVIKKVMILKIV